MKNLPSFIEFILESKIFTWELQSSFNHRDYFFSTNNYDYKVSVHDNEKDDEYPYVGFKSKKFDEPFYDWNTITNDDLYSVMNTIGAIIISDMKLNNVKGYTFSFSGDKHKNQQRFNLYKRMLKNWNIQYDEKSNHYKITK